MRRSDDDGTGGREPVGRDTDGPASETGGGAPSDLSRPASDQAPRLHGRPESPAEGASDVLPQAPLSPATAYGTPEPAPERIAGGVGALKGPRRRRMQEKAVSGALLFMSAISVLTTVGIVAVLLKESLAFFTHVSPVEFFTGTQWTPLFTPQRFGVLPLLVGSVQIAFLAAIIALPIGLLAAIYLSEYAPERARRIFKPTLEVLAGVPSIVYGYFALTFVTPMLKSVIPQTNIFNALSAGIVIAVMIVPLVASLSEDAMRAVPSALREGAYALGATKWEVSLRTVVPAALSGVVASFILAVSRAIGETMAVTIAAGKTPNLTWNPLESVQTMTAYIADISMGEVPFGSIEYQTIFAVGLTLFAITLTMNILSVWLLRRFREEYE